MGTLVVFIVVGGVVGAVNMAVFLVRVGNSPAVGSAFAVIAVIAVFAVFAGELVYTGELGGGKSELGGGRLMNSGGAGGLSIAGGGGMRSSIAGGRGSWETGERGEFELAKAGLKVKLSALESARPWPKSESEVQSREGGGGGKTLEEFWDGERSKGGGGRVSGGPGRMSEGAVVSGGRDGVGRGWGLGDGWVRNFC